MEYSIKQAELAENIADTERLKNLKVSIEKGDMLTPREIVRKYGGAARLIDDNKDYYAGFLLNPEYNLLDVIRYLKGVSLSQEVLLAEEVENNITSIVDSLDIPCYFVMGKYDYMTSVNAAREYFEMLEAPVKDFVLSEKSAHYPQFEEKELFADWLNKIWSGLPKTYNTGKGGRF